MPFNVFAAEEYALMAVGLPGVEHADWEAYQRMPKTNGEWFEFTGKVLAEPNAVAHRPKRNALNTRRSLQK